MSIKNLLAGETVPSTVQYEISFPYVLSGLAGWGIGEKGV